jgi:hypothetical protein
MIENGRAPYPYEEMLEWLEWANQGVPRAAQWTVGSKDHTRRIVAMDKNSDPFYAGQGWQKEAGEWFAEFHRRRVGDRRLHIRGLFYIATAEDPSPLTGEREATYLPDGSRFEKTKANWKWFQLASKFARNMELISARLILDKKRSRVTINARTREGDPPTVEYTEPEIRLPDGYSRYTHTRPATAGPKPSLFGGYVRKREPSVVEVWVEKDLDEADHPVVEQVCQAEGVNLVVGSGIMTISSAYALLERAGDLPVRILYLSDFDDAGLHMPVSPARHVEFAIRKMDPKPDVRLYHLALSAEQVLEQNIPRKIPTSDKDEEKIRRLKKFEARFGVGTVELNTLTDRTRADYFRRLLRDAIRELRDPKLREKERRAEAEAESMVAEELERQMRWPHKALQMIVEQAREKDAQFAEERQAIEEKAQELAAMRYELGRKIDAELAPLEERAEGVLQAARRRLAHLQELELPMVDAEEPEGAAEGWLFDSRRNYIEQLGYYVEHTRGIPVSDREEAWIVHRKEVSVIDRC